MVVARDHWWWRVTGGGSLRRCRGRTGAAGRRCRMAARLSRWSAPSCGRGGGCAVTMRTASPEPGPFGAICWRRGWRCPPSARSRAGWSGTKRAVGSAGADRHPRRAGICRPSPRASRNWTVAISSKGCACAGLAGSRRSTSCTCGALGWIHWWRIASAPIAPWPPCGPAGSFMAGPRSCSATTTRFSPARMRRGRIWGAWCTGVFVSASCRCSPHPVSSASKLPSKPTIDAGRSGCGGVGGTATCRLCSNAARRLSPPTAAGNSPGHARTRWHATPGKPPRANPGSIVWCCCAAWTKAVAWCCAQRVRVAAHWAHRLVRCEVDVQRQRVRFFGLRRRDPHLQPLLAERALRVRLVPWYQTTT